MPDRPRPKRSRKATNRVPTADKAVAEALAIVREARDADTEFDWTKNPANPRDAALRTSIMSHIVMEERTASTEWYNFLPEPDEEELASREASTARHICWKLEGLLPELFCDEIGEDLRDAIEYWERVEDEQQKRADQLKRRRLVRRARLDVGPSPRVS
jgi:hypothetical protein